MIQRMIRWLHNQTGRALKEGCIVDEVYPSNSTARADDSNISSPNNMTLNVYYATGGIVIRTHKYNRQTDRSNEALYVIREDQDVATELSRIMTTESLR